MLFHCRFVNQRYGWVVFIQVVGPGFRVIHTMTKITAEATDSIYSILIMCWDQT